MGRSFATPRPEILVEDFTKNNSYYHPASDTHYQMLNRNGVLIQRRYQIGFDRQESNVDEKQIDYIVGSGNHMRTYVHRNPDGTLLELPLAWCHGLRQEARGSMVSRPGIEPGTRRLRVCCSAN